MGGKSSSRTRAIYLYNSNASLAGSTTAVRRGACTDVAQTRAPNCLNHDCPSMDSSRAWTHACACKATQEERERGGRAGRRRASSYSPKASSPGSTPPMAAMKVWRDCICCQRSSSCAAAAARDGWQAGRGAARGSWTHARSTAGLSGSCDSAPAGAAAQVAARRPLETPARPVLP